MSRKSLKPGAVEIGANLFIFALVLTSGVATLLRPKGLDIGDWSLAMMLFAGAAMIIWRLWRRMR